MGLLRLAMILAALAVAASSGAAYHLWRWSTTPVTLSAPVIVEFPAGTSARRLASRLREAGVINDTTKFRLWARYVENYQLFQAGTYRFSGSITPQGVIDMIQQGRIYLPVALQITIPEGFTARQVLDRLAANGIGSRSQNAPLMVKTSLLRELKIPGPSLEGFLYPLTYQFQKLPTADEAIRRFVQTFWQKLPADYEAQARAMRLSLYQAVTFASLIELETRFDDEMPLIAEVIWRRLKDGAPLGIDAALIYGIPNYSGDIRWNHLRDASNRYNTRIHKGLPPTPIGSPSRQALLAVLNPTNTGNYFYVLTTDGSGRHHFSKTAKEHNALVKKLVESTSKSDSLQQPADKPWSNQR